MRLGLDLALASSGLPAQPWWREGALLDADFLASRFRFSGQSFASEADLLDALGAVRSGSTLVIGPQLAAGAPELVQNGNFAQGTDFWAAYNGGTIAASGGECVLTGNGGNAPAVSQLIAVLPKHAYRLKARARKGPSNSITPTVAVSSQASLAGNHHWSFGAVAGQSFVEVSREFSPFGPMHAGVRAIANPANGTVLLDDVSVREVVPCEGFVRGEFSALIEATAGASSGGTAQILVQADDNALAEAVPMERNFIRLAWEPDGHLRLKVSVQTAAGVTSQQANLDLGILSAGEAFAALVSVAEARVQAVLIGGVAVGKDVILVPGLAAVRLGRGHAGSAWGGTIGRATLWAGALDDAAFAWLSGNAS